MVQDINLNRLFRRIFGNELGEVTWKIAGDVGVEVGAGIVDRDIDLGFLNEIKGGKRETDRTGSDEGYTWWRFLGGHFGMTEVG